MKLTHTQRSALIHAYAPGYVLERRSTLDWIGFSTRTLRSLHRRGLLELDSAGGYYDAQLTQAGREALGLAGIADMTLGAAVRAAVRMFTEGEVEEFFAGDDVPPICDDEEEGLAHFVRTDTANVMAAICVDGTRGWFAEEEDPELLMDAAARLISEAGYPVVAENYGRMVYFVRVEADDDEAGESSFLPRVMIA